MDWHTTLRLVSDDLTFISRSNSWRDRLITLLFDLRFQTLVLYRLVQFFGRQKGYGCIAAPLLYFQQILSGCYINPAAEIGKRFKLAHPTGIVIGHGVKIGDGVTIYQHVTCGSHGRPDKQTGCPIVEDNVTIYANAVISGPIYIGQAAIIGAGAVVLQDVPPYTIVAGVPARVIGTVKKAESEIHSN